ncbi:MAG: DUF3267 domain-containing protein [Bacilli bacterium]|jgi:hypothetical protein|nr:DUF3267 domain-containing protein [Bacilli bacterium]MDY0209204.1 DUF3267 domain-containing protein [Bacilli bacterium]
MKNFYHELPLGYKAFKVIDAKDKKTILFFNFAAILMMALAAFPFIVLKPVDLSTDLLLPFILVLVTGMISYILFHELTHGLVYKFYTKQKLTFGLTLTVAFCGVPHVYVSKKVSLIAVLAPFVIYSVVLIPILLFMPANSIYLAFIFIFAMHFGGCVGDLYVALVLLRCKGNLLVNDTGPKQTFYRFEDHYDRTSLSSTMEI